MRHHRFPRGSIANEIGDVGDLLPDEQGDLAVKIAHGIIRFGDTLPDLIMRRPLRVTELPPEPDAGSRARIAAMGLGAGRRGQWLRR